jgi:hypothetical protein
MSANVFHAIATQFRARYLHPLQFPGSHRTVEDRVSALERGSGGTSTGAGQHLHTQPKPGTDEHFDHVMARSADALKRTSYADGNVEEAAHAQRMKRSGDILQNIRNTAAEHREWSPLPEERHQQAMSRSGELLGRIREAQAKIGPLPDRPASQPTRSAKPSMPTTAPVSAPAPSRSNYGLAATPAPRPMRVYRAPDPAPFTPPAGQAAPQHSPGGVGKGRQVPIKEMTKKAPYTKGKPVAPRAGQASSAPAGPGKGQMSFEDVKNPQQFPSKDAFHSMLHEVVNERKPPKTKTSEHDVPDWLR